MLQQTGVERVEEKYTQFLTRFPDFDSLAKAPLKEILRVWKGLGYNRRALSLKNAAGKVMAEYGGTLPPATKDLLSLPGVGKATASAVQAFAFDIPSVLIETNIRRVFIHFFFEGREGVTDGEIAPLVLKTVDRKNPREWYFALMDYGTALKEKGKNPNRRSAHYRKQAPFKGSIRQMRGKVLGFLLYRPYATFSQITNHLEDENERVRECLERLVAEGFLIEEEKMYRLA